MSRLTAIVLTLNEEANLRACMSSLEGWVDQIVVVDSGSTDQTLELARARGAHIYENPFTSHVQQWSWVLENVDIQGQWILALDADFVVTPELRDSITRSTADAPAAVHGFYLRRLLYFRGRPIRHGGAYPGLQLRLFRADSVSIDAEDVAEQHFYVKGKTRVLRGDILERNQKPESLAFWIEKQSRYAALQAKEEVAQRAGRRKGHVKGSLFGDHNNRVLALKSIWARLPLYWRSVAYFLYRYIVRLGFLDGRAGFLYHFCQSLVFRVSLDARVEELSALGSQESPEG